MDEINIEGLDNSTGTTIADKPMHEQQLAIYPRLRLINETINSLHVKIEGEMLNHCRFHMFTKTCKEY